MTFNNNFIFVQNLLPLSSYYSTFVLTLLSFILLLHYIQNLCLYRRLSIVIENTILGIIFCKLFMFVYALQHQKLVYVFLSFLILKFFSSPVWKFVLSFFVSASSEEFVGCSIAFMPSKTTNDNHWIVDCGTELPTYFMYIHYIMSFVSNYYAIFAI